MFQIPWPHSQGRGTESTLWEVNEMMADRSKNILIKKKKTLQQAVRQGLLFGGTAIAGGLAVCGQAVAQDQDQTSLIDEANELEEVIVTGSRLSRTGFDAATPMDSTRPSHDGGPARRLRRRGY